MIDEATTKKRRGRPKGSPQIGGRRKLAGGAASVVSIRVLPADLELIKQAAQADRRTVSQFLSIAGIERATQMKNESNDLFAFDRSKKNPDDRS